MKPSILSVPKHSFVLDFVLCALRVLCGLAFIQHGMGKIQHPMNWMGPDASTPAMLQAAAAFAEFGGGIALVGGFLTRLGALGIACVMGVAVHLHAMIKHDPFVNPMGGSSYEIAALYLAVMLLILVLGPGRFSLDRMIFGESK